MSVQQRPNGRWLARWRGPDGRERSRVFDTKREARAWEAEQQRSVRRSEWIDPDASRETVREFVERWRVAQAWRPSTADRMRSVLEVHVLPEFGDRPLGSIRQTDVQAWVGRLSAPAFDARGHQTRRALAPSSVEGVYHVLRMVMRAAVVDQRIARNPCEGVKLPRKERRLIVPLSIEQVEALAEHVRPELTAAVWLAAGCGLREGEILGLTADRIRFLHREIVVDRQMYTPAKGAPRFAPTKTTSSNRVVPAPSTVLEALSAHLELFGEGDDRLVFHSSGRPWRRTRFGEAWRAGREAAGVDARFHDLRHFCASSLVAAGVSVKGVQDVLGHASATETLEVYAHLWPTDRDRARDAMAAALERNAGSARDVSSPAAHRPS